MRDQELEQRLRAAIEHAAPDPLDRILSSCDAQKGVIVPMKNTTGKKNRWASLAVAAVLAIMVCGGFGLHGWKTTNAVAAVVSLDVNPSIQLRVNQREKVLSAEALNQDAMVILADMDLKNTDLNVAVNAIVGSLLQNGYLDSLSSAILISVEDQNPQRADRLQTELSAQVDATLQSAAAGAAVLSQIVTYDAGLETQAQRNHISVGKAALVRDVQALNGDLAFDSLAALSVEELKQLLETGAPALPIGKAAAIAAAEAVAIPAMEQKFGISFADSDIRWDVDPELDEMPAHYEVELETPIGSLDYEIDAYTGAILYGFQIPGQKTGTTQIVGATAASGPLVVSSQITEAQAQSIALEHAGVSAEKALGLRVNADLDDGVSHFDVEFRCSGVEYEYEIDAENGAILKAERDADDDWSAVATSDSASTEPSSASGIISADAAQSAALQHAGVASSNVSRMQCELDWEDGIQVYEIEFHAGQVEYEYEVHAVTGVVLKVQQDIDD